MADGLELQQAQSIIKMPSGIGKVRSSTSGGDGSGTQTPEGRKRRRSSAGAPEAEKLGPAEAAADRPSEDGEGDLATGDVLRKGRFIDIRI